MEYCYYRGEKCKFCNFPVPVFALGHHKPLREGKDEFSKKCMGFYKFGYSKSYFLERLVGLYNSRNDISFDIICLCPSSKKGEFNKYMEELTVDFSKCINVPYKKILSRIKNTKKQHKLQTKEERVINIKNSFVVSKSLNGKNILVIDNLSTTGSTIQEVHKVIIHDHNAKNCVFLCLGLGPKGKYLDFDINPTFKGKFSYIIKNWHWPKVPKEKRISK